MKILSLFAYNFQPLSVLSTRKCYKVCCIFIFTLVLVFLPPYSAKCIVHSFSYQGSNCPSNPFVPSFNRRLQLHNTNFIVHVLLLLVRFVYVVGIVGAAASNNKQQILRSSQSRQHCLTGAGKKLNTVERHVNVQI